MQILLVEDDIRLSKALAAILERDGYLVDAVADGAEGLAYAQAGSYVAIILDVMLPRMMGFEVAAEARRSGVSTPILMLTAKDSLGDKVTGLDSGADDYMTKPFAPVELLARIRALTRRQGEVVFERQGFGDLDLLIDSCELSCAGRSVRLSQKEFALMRVLLVNASRIMSKEQIIAKVWGVDSSAEDNNVEAYVSFLRKKIAYVGSQVRIVSVRRVGYRLECGDGAAAEREDAR